MILKSKCRVVGFNKKTSAKFFKDLKIGDEFELHYDLNGGYTSAPAISILVDGKFVIYNNATQLAVNLNKFVLEGKE